METFLRRKPRPELKPPDTLSRFVVTKHAWYKHYKRIFLITPTAIHTQNPERTLVLTNTYTFAGDSDIESVSLGGDDFEFIISARQDKRVSPAVHAAPTANMLPCGAAPGWQHFFSLMVFHVSLHSYSGEVQAPQVHLQAQAAAADRLVPMHGSSFCHGQVPDGLCHTRVRACHALPCSRKPPP